jgi:hypothetical protein
MARIKPRKPTRARRSAVAEPDVQDDPAAPEDLVSATEESEDRLTGGLLSNHNESRQTRGLITNHNESRQTRGLEMNHNESRARA